MQKNQYAPGLRRSFWNEFFHSAPRLRIFFVQKISHYAPGLRKKNLITNYNFFNMLRDSDFFKVLFSLCL